MPQLQEPPSIAEAVAEGQIQVQAVGTNGNDKVVVCTPRLELEDNIRAILGQWRGGDEEEMGNLVAVGESVNDALASAFAKGVGHLTAEEWEDLCDDVVIALVLKIAAGQQFDSGPDAPLSSLGVLIDQPGDGRDILARGGLDPALEQELGINLGMNAGAPSQVH